MEPENLFALVVFLAAVGVGILNDWWKRRLVEKAEKNHSPVRKDWKLNNADWSLTLSVVVLFGVVVYFWEHPALAEYCFGDSKNALVRFIIFKE